MHEEVISPLLEGDLEGAAYICLAAAATTDLNQFPPESGNISRRKHHERKRRFEDALAKMREGITSLSELGLSPDDCAWAARKANLAKDQKGWLSRFQEAEEMLREAC
jgi:hypothetical protein